MTTQTADEFTQVVLGRIVDSVEASPMTHKDIAAAAHLTPARMRRKLQGSTVLTVTDVCAFARVLGLDVIELVAA